MKVFPLNGEETKVLMNVDILSHFGDTCVNKWQEVGVAGHLTQLEAGTGELRLKVRPSPGPGLDLYRKESALVA